MSGSPTNTSYPRPVLSIAIRGFLDGDPVLQRSGWTATIVPLIFLQVSSTKQLRQSGNPATSGVITLVTVKKN